MRVLALDTSSPAGSVALVEDDRIVAERSGDGSRPQAERLPNDLLRLLDEAGVPLASVDLFAVAAGPGSFTGLRIGIATIQGMAFVTQKRVVPVSTLEALAHATSIRLTAGQLVASLIDAHRHDVFSALYRVASHQLFTRERLVELEAPAVGDPSATVQRWIDRFGSPTIFAGDGATAYAEGIDGLGLVIGPPPLAATIGLMAVVRAQAGETVDPGGVRPLYVRRPDAEIARDKILPQATQRTQT